jgi:hypothetical protein
MVPMKGLDEASLSLEVKSVRDFKTEEKRLRLIKLAVGRARLLAKKVKPAIRVNPKILAKLPTTSSAKLSRKEHI